MAPTQNQTVQNFLNFYYQNGQFEDFEELLKGNTAEKSFDIFLSRLDRTCNKLGCEISHQDANALWTYVINGFANKMMQQAYKQAYAGWDYSAKARVYAENARVILEGKAALLAMKLDEPLGRKRRGEADEKDEIAAEWRL